MRTFEHNRLWISVVLALVLAAAGCTTTPPTEDEPPVEEPEPDEEDVDDEPDDEDDVDDEEIDVDDEEDEPDIVRDPEEADEQLASHVDARIESAIDSAEDGDIDDAIAELEDLIAEPEGGFMASYNAGVLRDRRGEYDEAADLYEAALQRQPDFTPALQNLIRLYVRAERIDDANEIAGQYIEYRPDNLDHQAAHLDVWLEQGRYEDTVEQARDILRRDVQHVDAMLQMATAKYRLERWELAEAIMERALQLAPERAESFYLLGQIKLGQDERDAARANFQQALELDPYFAEARNNLAIMRHEAGNFDSAFEHLQKVVDHAPHYVEAWVNLGNTQKAMGDYGDAEQSYQEALAIDDRFAEGLYNLGLLYLEAPVPDTDDIPRWEQAIDVFNEFRDAVGQREASQTPVSTYISDASSKIENERERQDALREAQMGSEPDEEDVEELDDVDDVDELEEELEDAEDDPEEPADDGDEQPEAADNGPEAEDDEEAEDDDDS